MGLFGPIRSLKKDLCVRAKFINDLAAGAARRAWNSLFVDHRDGLDFNFRPTLGNRRKNRRALGAIRHSIRSILHVASGEYLPIRQQDRRADTKFRIRRVRIFHDIFCGSNQALLLFFGYLFLGHSTRHSRFAIYSAKSCAIVNPCSTQMLFRGKNRQKSAA